MCELFALNAEGPVNTNAYLREFFSHSVNHPHGWGISWRDGDPFDDASVTLVREGRRAIDSDLNWKVLGSPTRRATSSPTYAMPRAPTWPSATATRSGRST